ncbi:hypothetical protein F66182_6662 [Fusarium sp. NRRL 66182]|nr:hypothetical protein F66182_6662 [Fusarium sp. NRRL 66182]
MAALPNEIWHQIIANFEEYIPLKTWRMYGSHLVRDAPEDLRALSLVCRQFRRIAQPLLYRTIIAGRREEDKLGQALAVRTLTENPQLGELARIVSVDEVDQHQWEMDSVLGGTTMRDIIVPALKYLDIPPALKTRLRVPLYFDGFAALGIAFMPQLQLVDCTIDDVRSPLPWMLSGTLGLEDEILRVPKNQYADYYDDEEEEEEEEEHHHQGEDDTNKMKLQNIPKSSYANYGFPNLTEVRIRTVGGPEGITPAWVIEPLLLHPTLKTLRALGTDWFDVELKNLKWPVSRSNIEHLDLTESIIDAEGLKHILIRCPSLKGLSIELASCRREMFGDYEGWDVDLDDIGDILRQFGKGLEAFDLYTPQYNRAHCTEGRLGSLQELGSLRHLKANKKELLGPQVQDLYGDIGDYRALRLSEALPPSLETLYLHWDGHYFDPKWYGRKRARVNEEVQGLILENKHPNLREIRVERRLNTKDKHKEWPVESNVEGWEVDVVDEMVREDEEDYGSILTFLILKKCL